MPYIKANRRAELVTYSYDGSDPRLAETAGELNYQITMLCKQFVAHHGLSYLSINDIIGALEGAKAEFYRRVAAPYEDTKIKENGDVY